MAPGHQQHQVPLLGRPGDEVLDRERCGQEGDVEIAAPQRGQQVDHNYRPGVAERLGLDYASVRAVNPRLVYGAASAYGSRGVERTARAYDLLGLAHSGIMDASAAPGSGEPGHPKGAIADQAGAIALAYGVLAALVARERHGLGQQVETSLLGGMLWLQNISIATQLLVHTSVSSGHRHSPANPLWNYYRCADGRWLALAMPQSDRYWALFLDVIGRPDLAADARFIDQPSRGKNSTACVEILDEVFAAHPRDWWIERLSREKDMPFTPVNSIAEAADDPQAAANDYVVGYDHPVHGWIRTTGFPVSLSETLVQGTNGPELAPMVARSWEFDGAGKVVTFHLRDDVTFADGSKLDAAAVEASLNRALSMPGSTARAPLSLITSVAAPDPATVVITTNRPAADLPYLLSTGFGSIINPKALTSTNLDVDPQGSGPYRVVEARLNDGAVYERRDGYWDPEAGKVKRIELRGVPDPNARINAIRSGQSDFALIQAQQYTPGAEPRAGLPGPRLPRRRQRADPTAQPDPAPRVRRPGAPGVELRGRPPGDQHRDPRRPRHPDEPAADPLYPGHLTDPPLNYTYDPQRARDLLAQAGLAGGLTLRVMVARYSPITEISQVLQAQLKQVGVTLDLVPTDAVQIAGQWKPGTDFDGMLQARVNSETAAGTLALNFLTPNGYIGTPPPDFAAAIAKANDPALTEYQRTQALQAASTIATEQAFDVYLNISPSPTLTTDKIVGAETMGRAGYQGIFDLRYVGLRSTT